VYCVVAGVVPLMLRVLLLVSMQCVAVCCAVGDLPRMLFSTVDYRVWRGSGEGGGGQIST